MTVYNHLPTDQLSWLALFVRTKREFSVQRQLREKGYETYIPCRQEHRQWVDRVKVAATPLFPNYVFCRFPPRDCFRVVTTPEVYSVVGIGKTPTPIPVEEIEAIRCVVQAGTAVDATDRLIEPGERVLVTSGVLKGLEGIVVRAKNGWRLVVALTLLQRGVATEISRECVEVLTSVSGPTASQSNLSLKWA